MEILSSRHFPPEMQGNLLVANVIGFQGIQRIRLEDKGASFAGIHEEPILSSTDPKFRPSDLRIGPDGALYFLDWHNPIIGHMQHNLRDPSRDREHGRIYRVTYEGRPLLTPPKIAGEPIEKLLDLLQEPEDRVRYRARIELTGRDSEKVVAAAKKWLTARLAEKDKRQSSKAEPETKQLYENKTLVFPVKPNENERFRSVNALPWTQVFEWLTKETKMPVHFAGRKITLPDTFIVANSAKKHTLLEVIDIINDALFLQKYVLIRTNDSFIVYPMDVPIPPQIVSTVTVAELENRARTEVVSVLVKLQQDVEADEVAPVFKRMMSPMGEVSIVPNSNQLMLQDMAGTLKRVVADLAPILAPRIDSEIEHDKMEILWLHQSHNVVNADLLKEMLASPDFRARAAATKVLCYWRNVVPDALELLKKQAADLHPRVRLEAIRAASFFKNAEAVEIVLISTEHPTDQYIDFTRAETMKALQPHVDKAIKEGRQINFTSLAGARFFLKNVATENLLKMKGSRPIYTGADLPQRAARRAAPERPDLAGQARQQKRTDRAGRRHHDPGSAKRPGRQRHLRPGPSADEPGQGAGRGPRRPGKNGHRRPHADDPAAWLRGADRRRRRHR